MDFLAYWDGDIDNGWYVSIGDGIDIDNPNWVFSGDPNLLGPFATEDEAIDAIDSYLKTGDVDSGTMAICSAHAAETIEADMENYPGNEFAKRRFQNSVKAFANVTSRGNPHPLIVAVAAGSLFVHLCAAYPNAGAEVFRIVGNQWRRERGIPELELGKEPDYEL